MCPVRSVTYVSGRSFVFGVRIAINSEARESVDQTAGNPGQNPWPPILEEDSVLHDFPGKRARPRFALVGHKRTQHIKN